MVFIIRSTPPSIHPAGFHAGHQFLNLKCQTKSYWLLDLDTALELTRGSLLLLSWS